jgi:hypothetical protein
VVFYIPAGKRRRRRLQGSEPAAFVPPQGGDAMDLLIELRKIIQALASLIRAINKMK